MTDQTQGAPFRIEPEDFVESLRGFAEALNVEVARDLAVHFGGTRLFIPKFWRDDLPLNMIGVDHAKRLCALFGPETVDIPLGPYRSAALQRFAVLMRANDVSVNQMARVLGVSYRTVQTHLSRNGAERRLTPRGRRVSDERQIDLVDWLGGKSDRSSES